MSEDVIKNKPEFRSDRLNAIVEASLNLGDSDFDTGDAIFVVAMKSNGVVCKVVCKNTANLPLHDRTTLCGVIAENNSKLLLAKKSEIRFG